MCTAVSYTVKDHYFGRNLDLERFYDVNIVITPRQYPFHLKNGTLLSDHYAIIGMSAVAEDYPLYFEGTNEKGLSLAGLNFPGNARYQSYDPKKENIAPFELIPYLLGTCADVPEAVEKLERMNLWDISFSAQYPLSPLHWMLSDRNAAMVIECTAEGLKLYANHFGVLTNNPPFPYHMHNAANYMQLTDEPPANRQPVELTPYSLGMGSFGLPGDMSSGSRFVKAAFTKMHSRCNGDEGQAVSQFFHILGSVCQQRGMTRLDNGAYEYTLYSSCCNTDRGIYYYTTYDNSSISAVCMHHVDLNGSSLIRYPLLTETVIHTQN